MDGELRTVSYRELGRNGRLGNCLFQIAATWSYGLRHNRIVQLPEWEYFKYFKFPFQTNNDIRVDKTYIEPVFSFNEIPEFEEDHVNLNGYYQSYKYSNDIDLNVLFELKDNWKESIDELYKKINPNRLHTIAVHHRRGDYLNPGTFEYHGVLDINYYLDAFNTILTERGLEKIECQILVFSDDIKAIKDSIFFKHFPHVYFSETQSLASCKEDYDIIDLYLMSKADSIITANSSFSYWGALLGKKDKMVVAPSNWFGETGKHNITKDLYKPEWIKI